MFDSHCHIHTKDSYFCSHEIMIDRRFKEDLQTQKEKAKSELQKLKENNTKATVHCVQATKYMLDVLNEVKPYPKSVMWHNFNGSPETARELYKLGVIISIGPRCTKDIKAITESNPFFTLESDYTGSDENEQKAIISGCYKKVSKILNISLEELEKRCLENAFTS